MKRHFTRYGLIACLLLLGACSSTTFIYNRLDFLLPWYLGDYMELSRPQKKLLDDLLEPYLYWHRSEELPRYLEIVEKIDDSLDQPLQLADVEAVSDMFEAAWGRLEETGLTWILELGANMSDEQIAAFLIKLQEQQGEYEEKYLTRSEQEYREETYESLLDSFTDYLGRLDASQKLALKDTSAAMQRSDTAWLEERAAWMLRLEVLLQRAPGWEQGIRDALAERDENASPEYRQMYTHNILQIQQAIVSVTNSRTDKQDRRLRKKLNNLREDLQTLIEQGRESAGAGF
ncbi:MAG: DUF6279 family lipoprotein [Halioglobus sp.]